MKGDLRINWLVAIAVGGWFLWLLAPVLTPFFAAGLLAYVGDPLADRLQKLRMPRTLAVVAVFVLTFCFIGFLVLLLGPLVRAQVTALIDVLPELATQVEQVWLPTLADVFGFEIDAEVGVGPFLTRYGDMVGDWGGTLVGAVSRSGGALAAAVISLFLIPVLTFYMLRDWDSIMSRLGALVPESQRETVYSLARETDEVLGAFLRGQLMVMLALATIYSIGLSLVGINFALAIGVVSGLISFVPYLGLVVGMGLALLVVVVEPNPLIPIIGVIATFTIAQMLEGMVLTPKLVGDRIGLHPVLVIFAVAAGGQLFGFFGILLALPAAAALSVFVTFAYKRYLIEHPEAAIELGESQR